MCYRGGRGVVPTDESTSICNCGDAYDGIRPGCGSSRPDDCKIPRVATEIHDMSGKHLPVIISLLSGGTVRRNSLRCAPFGPPTVSCVLAPARTCLRQAPPTSRGRGLATSAVPHHLTDSLKYCQSGYKIIKKEKFSTHPIC